ncbi:MAG TPA: hypothetical protein VNN72_00430, partial [Polyangiaceae bacterium]|nr:hypothetical protein [Polyangiaceae bacterium]
ILHFATDFSLIGAERAWSLVLDLNEGMIIGLPGLLLTLPVAAALAWRDTPASERAALGLDIGGTLLLVVAMAAPTLAIHNWNSAAIVFIRYGYWLSMPLLVLFAELLGRLERRPRSYVAGSFVALQAAVLALNGVVGERSSYVRHSWAAKLVLERRPSAYNPVPEIFYERSMGWEPVEPKDVVVWPYRGTPGKLMVRGELPQSDRVCPNGGIVQGARVHAVSDGWRYLDPPFRCEPMP